MLELAGSPVINREEYNLRDLSEYTPSVAEHLRASWSSNTALNPTAQAYDLAKLNELRPKEPASFYFDEMGNQVPVAGAGTLDPGDVRARRLSLDEANQKGEPIGLRFSEPPTQGQFDYLKDLKQAENSRDEVLSHTPLLSVKGALGLVAGFGASAIDPLNIATAFVPVVGEGRFGRMVTRIGIQKARLAKGALEGGVGNALTIPLVYSQAEALQQRYGVQGAFMDVVMGAGLGAGLHWGGGAIGDLYRGRMQKEAARVMGVEDTPKVDRRKVNTPEGENSVIVESMNRNERTENLRAAVKAVETDTVPKIDEILKTAPELRELGIPDKRFPATQRLRSDVTATDFATGSRAADVHNQTAERLASGKSGGGAQGLFKNFAGRYKKLGDYSVKLVSREEFAARSRNLLEHPEQQAVLESGSKTILATDEAPLGAIRHEIERAIDEAYGTPGDQRGGYRYAAKDIEGQTAHRRALRELYDEQPARSPARASPKDAVDAFSKRDEPIMGHQGPKAADDAWDVVQDLKDKDLETYIKDEEIAAVEDIAKFVEKDARNLGVLEKVIPLEERQILEEAAAKLGKQQAMKGLIKASDAAVEREVKTDALEEAEILMRGGAEALKGVIIEGKSVKQVVADVVAREGLVTRAQALRSIDIFQKDSDTPLSGAALERAIKLVQDGEAINVAVQGADLLARADQAAEAPSGAASDFKAPGEEKADQGTEEDAFGDLQADAEIALEKILATRELAEAEARLVREEHDLLAANAETKDLASTIERTEFNEAQRDRAFREGDGTLIGSERGRAGGSGTGGALEDGLHSARPRRDGEAARGQSVATERERSATGGERAAPETAVSYGAGTVPRRVVTPDGTIEVSVEPRLVELDDLVHAEGDLLTRGPWDEASVVEALALATKLDPGQFMPDRIADAGAPIVAARSGGGYVIVSGNRRMLSVRHIYGDNTLAGKANEYRDRLGPAADGYRRPVLVQVITDQLSSDELIKFAERANRSRIAEMSGTQKAQRDADAAGIDVMSLYRGGDFTQKENQPFVRAFLRKISDTQEMREISKNGPARFTQAVLNRLDRAIFGAAYDDTGVLARMLKSPDNDIKSIASAYRDAAPVFMKLRAEIAQGLVREEMDITPYTMKAARFVQDAKDNGVKIQDALVQLGALDPVVDRLIRQFYDPQLLRANSALRIGEVLQGYAEAAREKRITTPLDDIEAPETAAPVELPKFMSARPSRFRERGTPMEEQARLDAEIERNAGNADETLLAPDEVDAGARAGESGGEAPQRAPEAVRDLAEERGAGAGETAADRPAVEAAAPVTTREAFYDYLEGDKPVRGAGTIAKALDIDETAAYALLDEAVEAGWLKLKDNGTYLRLPKDKRPARPGFENAPSFAIDGYHGSNADFDRVDLSKIGSGDGSQAYGHGAYLAADKTVGAGFGPNLYKMRFDADSHELLQWEVPLSQQSTEVQAAIKKLSDRFTILKRDIPSGYLIYSNINNRLIREQFDGDTSAEASRLLREVGIKGVEFEASGKKNYVAFSTDDLRVIEKNGKPVRPGSFADNPEDLIRKTNEDLDAIIGESTRPPNGWGADDANMERQLQTGLALQRAIGDALHRVPEGVIRFEVMDKISMMGREAAAAFVPLDLLIKLSRNMLRLPVDAVNHEIFHALRWIKLFTDFEWNIIRNTFASAEGIPAERQRTYRAYWVEEARRMGADENDPRIDDRLVEEWAATNFGQWIAKRSSERETPLGMLWGRAKDFLSDLRSSFDNLARRAVGMDEKFTHLDIFRAIEDGSMAKRWEEWGMGRKDGTNPLSAKSMALDEQVKDMNKTMRDIAEDKFEKIGRVREEALKALAPCAAHNL